MVSIYKLERGICPILETEEQTTAYTCFYLVYTKLVIIR